MTVHVLNFAEHYNDATCSSHICVPKQRHGSHIGVPSHSSGNLTLFFGKIVFSVLVNQYGRSVDNFFVCGARVLRV